MATISEAVSVLHVKDANLDAVDSCFDIGHIVVTQKTKYISVVEVESQKTVKSWSIRRGHLLTSPTVWSDTDGFLTVIDKKEVRIWSKDEVNFEKCKKRHFKFDIHQILAIKGYHPIVVCTNGAVDFLSKIKDTYSEQNQTEDSVIVRCQAFILQDKLHVISLVKNQDGYHLRNHSLVTEDDTESQWTCETSKVDIPESVSICSCDMKQFGSDVKCNCLCSSGDLYNTVISSNRINTYRLCTINTLQKTVAMVILNSTHIAVSGIQHENQIGLGIYDTRFNVIQTFKAFTDKVTEDVKLFHINNRLYTSYGKTLYMYPYSCQRSTVANILGKQNLMANTDHTWKTVTWLSIEEKKENDKEENIRNLLQQLSDKSQVSKYKIFKEKFEILKPLLSDHSSHSSLMLQFVQRCLNEEKFFPKTEIQHLIENQAIPSVLVPHLFDALIKDREIEQLQMTLHYLTDIPESCLCKLLQFLLSLEDKDLPIQKSKQSLEGCPLSQAKLVYINQILQMPYNDVFLVECMRTLSFKNVLILLEYLYYLLNKGPDGIEDIVNNPKLTQVVDWLCCVLDGHFTQLIISPDAREVLVNLHSIVETQVEYYDELLGLDALLQQLKSRSAIPQNKMVGQYCIEVLHIL